MVCPVAMARQGWDLTIGQQVALAQNGSPLGHLVKKAKLKASGRE